MMMQTIIIIINPETEKNFSTGQIVWYRLEMHCLAQKC